MVLKPFQKVVKAARQNHIAVVFVRVVFSKGYQQNKSFSVITKSLVE
ncbi:hypothetical protein [Gottfriedia acidiceleris]